MKYIFIGFFISLLFGCASYQTWQNPSYNEQVSHFLTTDDGEKLIVIGDEYHYIFNEAQEINNVLQWDYNNLLKANFESFYVTPKNRITGKYRIICNCLDATESQIRWLQKNRFTKGPDKTKRCPNNYLVYIKEAEIVGDRYLSNDIDFNSYKKFNDKYIIRVEEEYKLGDIIGRVAMTPIAATIDGYIIIGGISIAIIGSPLMLTKYITQDESDDFCAKENIRSTK